MNEKCLTNKEAFLAMYAFTDNYYQLTQDDEIGDLLGSMSLLPDGETADPAIQSEWKEAVNKVLEGKVNANLNLEK